MNMILEINDYGIVVKTQENGVINSKIVDPEDIARALANQVKIDTGILPRNTRYYAKKDNGGVIVLEMPEHTRRIEHSRVGESYIVPMPYTCFVIFYHTNNDRYSDTYYVYQTFLFATMGPILDSSTVLYRFPFGNVGSNGLVCWGTVQMPTVSSLSELSIVPELLLGSKFNGDLGAGSFMEFEHPDNPNVRIFQIAHLMRYLDGKDSFPYEILVRNGILKDVLKI